MAPHYHKCPYNNDSCLQTEHVFGWMCIVRYNPFDTWQFFLFDNKILISGYIFWDKIKER